MSAMRQSTDTLRVGVVGLGYVGVPLVNLAARKQHPVVGIDVDTKKIASLNTGAYKGTELYIQPEYLHKQQVSVGVDFSALRAVDVIVICVPTPVTKDFHPNLEPVKNACKAIAPHLQKGQLVVLESTVNPGVTRSIVVPLLEHAGLQAGRDFSVAHCPERINPGDTKWNVSNIPRVVGGLNQQSLELAQQFYASVLDAPLKPMQTLEEAEAVKIVENSFRDINIAFVNELARSFTRLNIDVVNVIEGASTKPFSFLAHYPGMGVGGHCIPVDPYYLIEQARANGFYHDFLSLARRINNDMPSFLFDRLGVALNEHKLPVNGTPVALLGLSYKPGVGDTRESPALVLLEKLQSAGADLHIFDPYIPERSTGTSLNSALKGAKVLVLATAHPEFGALDFMALKQDGLEIVVDGRNFFDKSAVQAAGLTYVGVGR